MPDDQPWYSNVLFNAGPNLWSKSFNPTEIHPLGLKLPLRRGVKSNFGPQNRKGCIFKYLSTQDPNLWCKSFYPTEIHPIGPKLPLRRGGKSSFGPWNHNGGILMYLSKQEQNLWSKSFYPTEIHPVETKLPLRGGGKSSAYSYYSFLWYFCTLFSNDRRTACSL